MHDPKDGRAIHFHIVNYAILKVLLSSSSKPEVPLSNREFSQKKPWWLQGAYTKILHWTNSPLDHVRPDAMFISIIRTISIFLPPLWCIIWLLCLFYSIIVVRLSYMQRKHPPPWQDHPNHHALWSSPSDCPTLSGPTSHCVVHGPILLYHVLHPIYLVCCRPIALYCLHLLSIPCLINFSWLATFALTTLGLITPQIIQLSHLLRALSFTRPTVIAS